MKNLNEIKASDWERTGKHQVFDNSEGTFCSFYNESEEKNLHVWHQLDGRVRLLDENMCFEYGDKDSDENDQEIDNIHELLSVL